MRLLFVIFTLIHAAIHLMGFLKAWDIAAIKQLTLPISKTVGILWLSTFILFSITFILFSVKINYWWLLGFISVVLSQLLIVALWQDARFGTIANSVILMVCLIGFSTWRYYHAFQNDVSAMLHKSSMASTDLVSEENISHLPEPVKKYLRYTGAIGKPKVTNFKINFSGKIRKNELSEWMPFASEQYNFIAQPTRLFFMNAIMKHLPVAGYHAYNDGEATMDIRLLSLFRVQYQAGSEMNIAETVTFFNDMCCMAPPTLIDQRIQWLEVEGNKVKASFTHKEITIYAWLYFNDKGELINFTSNDRYAADAKEKLPWSTPLSNYTEINGFKLPANAEAIYSYPEGDLTYGTFQLQDVQYNVK